MEMEMKKTIYILSMAFVWASCDVLIEDNKGGIPNEEFYQTSVGYSTLITASYASLRTIYGDTPWLLLTGTDIYVKSRLNFPTSLYEYESLYPSDTYVAEFYSGCYAAIQTINTALYYNDTPTDMSDSDREKYKSEMRFLRAYYHFLLLEQFGGITINDEITLSPRTNMPRNTLEDCYEFIITEMEDCISSLETSTVAIINKDVVNHYLAKVYLTRAWDLNNQNDFTTAKSYAQKVFDTREMLH